MYQVFQPLGGLDGGGSLAMGGLSGLFGEFEFPLSRFGFSRPFALLEGTVRLPVLRFLEEPPDRL